MNGSDALRDEVLDEISLQYQRWTYVVQRFVIELREQVEMIAGAHTGHDRDQAAICVGESGEHRCAGGAFGGIAEVSEEAAVALVALVQLW